MKKPSSIPKVALVISPSGFDLRRAPEMLAPVAAIYEAMFREHGLSEAGVGCMDGNQKLRFDTLSQLLPRNSPQLDIADLGCGYGALFDYLNARAEFSIGSYTGYDISEAMVQAAVRRTSDPRASFHQSLVVTKPADFCFASGTYTMCLDADAATWTAYILESLKNMARMSRFGFAFNLLCPVPRGDTALFRSDPGIFVEFCENVIGGRVQLIRDYGLPEWTLYVTGPRA